MPPAELMILHRHRFVKDLAASLRDRCGLRGGERIVVGVSGGADSTALLLALSALAPRPEWKLDLCVAHVHHHLRDDADKDERFVARLADSLDLEYRRRDIRPADNSGNTESIGRRLRYAALLEVAREIDADLVATAHHADDQLETLLMRLIRGSGPHGMRGIAPRRRLQNVTIIRPLLFADRATITAFLREHDQPWREDHTNGDLTRTRALLRSQVLPALRQLKPDAARKAVDTADQFAAGSQLIQRVTRRALRVVENHTLPRDRARRLSPLLLGEITRHLARSLGAHGDALGQRVIKPIIAAMRDSRGDERHFNLAGGVRVTVTREHCVWQKI